MKCGNCGDPIEGDHIKVGTILFHQKEEVFHKTGEECAEAEHKQLIPKSFTRAYFPDRSFQESVQYL